MQAVKWFVTFDILGWALLCICVYVYMMYFVIWVRGFYEEQLKKARLLDHYAVYALYLQEYISVIYTVNTMVY